MIYTKQELDALQRADLHSFTCRVFAHLNKGKVLQDNWHHWLIAWTLMECMAGRIRRLIINLPPRGLKSIAASIALPAFWLGHRPSTEILCVSYAMDLAEKLSRDTLDVMKSPWYQDLFPGVLSGRQRADEFMTTRNGCRRARSVHGSVTGFGADVIIVDDPIKPDGGMSEATRKSTNDWYDNALPSRLSTPDKGVIIIVMQRLHPDDLVGHVLASGEKWHVLSLPAVFDSDRDFAWEDLSGPKKHRVKAGELLHPARWSKAFLDAERKRLSNYTFCGQYQQQPIPVEGAIIKKAWIRTYSAQTRPQRFDDVIQSWDTAYKVGEANDYSVCVTIGVLDGKYYVLDVFRGRLEYPDLQRVARRLSREHGATAVLVEDKGSGTSLVQSLEAAGVQRVYGVEPASDKVTRVSMESPLIESGSFFMPEEAPWLQEYLQELTTFPGCKHDDQVDATVQALRWYHERPTISVHRLRV